MTVGLATRANALLLDLAKTMAFAVETTAEAMGFVVSAPVAFAPARRPVSMDAVWSLTPVPPSVSPTIATVWETDSASPI